jgi:hypothetical protein
VSQRSGPLESGHRRSGRVSKKFKKFFAFASGVAESAVGKVKPIEGGVTSPATRQRLQFHRVDGAVYVTGADIHYRGLVEGFLQIEGISDFHP